MTLELAHNLSMSLQSEAFQAAGVVDIDRSIVFVVAVFLLFAILMHYLLFKPLIVAQEARHKGLDASSADLDDLKLRTATLRKNYDDRLQAARQDAVSIREDLKKAAETKGEAEVSAAKAEQEERLEAASHELKAFEKSARDELKVHAEALAIELSKKLLEGKSA